MTIRIGDRVYIGRGWTPYTVDDLRDGTALLRRAASIVPNGSPRAYRTRRRVEVNRLRPAAF